MSPEEKSFLSLRTLPARLDAEQAGWYLGCNLESVTVLMAAGLLKPLGRPAANAAKFFALAELEQLRADPKWMSRATEAIQNWHRKKNHSSRNGGSAVLPPHARFQRKYRGDADGTSSASPPPVRE